jgi:hypothetical protein
MRTNNPAVPAPEPPISGDEYWTAEQLAATLHVCERTLLRWRRDGGGPRFCRAGIRHVIYPAADVRAWLAGRTHTDRAAEAAAA